MIPLLTYPLALIALAALPALTAIYLLRNRYRRHTVSSLMFWRVQARVKEGGAKRDRLQLPLVFFLELLTLVLLVCAATGPRWQTPRTVRPLIVVLDNSLSMRAGPPGEQPRHLAELALKKLLNERRFRSLRAILAGQTSRIAAAQGESASAVDEFLALWTCQEATAALDQAIVLASEIGRRDADILVLTDHAPGNPQLRDTRVRWLAFGQKLPNQAFVNARRSPYLQEDRCLFEVANFSAVSRRVGLSLRQGSNELRQSQLDLSPGQREKIVLNVPARALPLEAVLSADALEEDNRVILASPVRKKVRVKTSLSDPIVARLVDRALTASGLRASIDEPPELIIHQSPQNVTVSDAWDLRLFKEETTATYTGPFVVDSGHPLCAGLSLDGVIWSGPKTNPAAGIPIISAGNVPLLTSNEDALGRNHLSLALDLELSTVAASPNWPAFFWNLLSWRIAESPGLKEVNYRLGTEVEVTAASATLNILGPDRSIRQVPVRSDPVLFRTEQVGLHALMTDQWTNLFAVNFLAPEESDLTGCITGEWGQWLQEQDVRYEYESVLWLFLLLALGVLTWHLSVLARSPVTT
jgi:hypothetical protein